ncbi:MAG: putative Ig domain-containing protein [bacterium]
MKKVFSINTICRLTIVIIVLVAVLIPIVLQAQTDVTDISSFDCDGDLNEDGNITPQDALIAFRCYLGLDTCPECADVNGDGSVTPSDALCIFKKYLGQPSCLCTDNDGDGFTVEGGNCGLIDCYDDDPDSYPGAMETCGDGLDQNCDDEDLSCVFFITSPLTTAFAGKEYRERIEALSALGKSLTYSLIEPPEGLTIDTIRGEITWIPSESQAGDDQITVKVTDGVNTETLSYTITVSSVKPLAAKMISASKGGTITVTDQTSGLNGVTLSIPAGALDVDTEITIGEVLSPPPPGIEEVYLHPPINIGPESLRFMFPATLKIPYSESILAKARFKDGLKESNLKFEVWEMDSWMPYNFSVDTEKNTIASQVDHNGSFSGQVSEQEITNYQTTHFLIKYKEKGEEGVLLNEKYGDGCGSSTSDGCGSLDCPVENPPPPDYVRDLASFLEYAYKQLDEQGYNLPNRSILVELKDLENLGETASNIALDNDMIIRDSKRRAYSYLEIQDILRYSSAHELFHVIQHTSFVDWDIIIKNNNNWLFESTAEWIADKIWNDYNFYNNPFSGFYIDNDRTDQFYTLTGLNMGESIIKRKEEIEDISQKKDYHWYKGIVFQKYLEANYGEEPIIHRLFLKETPSIKPLIQQMPAIADTGALTLIDNILKGLTNRNEKKTLSLADAYLDFVYHYNNKMDDAAIQEISLWKFMKEDKNFHYKYNFGFEFYKINNLEGKDRKDSPKILRHVYAESVYGEQQIQVLLNGKHDNSNKASVPENIGEELKLLPMSGATYVLKTTKGIPDPIKLEFETTGQIRGNIYLNDSDSSHTENTYLGKGGGGERLEEVVINGSADEQTIIINVINPSFYTNNNATIKIKAYYYQPFYIRFTCNGHIPKLGGKTIMVKSGVDGAKVETLKSIEKNPDLVGPFNKVDDIAYAYLYYLGNTGVAELFAHYQDVGKSGDWEYAFSLSIKNSSCEEVIDMDEYPHLSIFYYTHDDYYTPDADPEYPPEECNLFVKRVEWKKHQTKIFNCPKHTEIINGVTSTVYTLDFNNLFLIKEIRYSKVPSETSCTEWVNNYFGFDDFEGGWDTVSFKSYISDEYDQPFDSGIESQSWYCEYYYSWSLYLDHDEVPSIPEDTRYEGEENIYPYIDIASFSGRGKNVILSDKDGNNPSFRDISYSIDAYIDWGFREILHLYDCNITYIDKNGVSHVASGCKSKVVWDCKIGWGDHPESITVKGIQTVNYSMELAPADRF